MKKGTVVTGTVEGLSFPNKGILTVEDSRMVVKNTIPGQVIEAVVTKNGSNRMEGRLQRVVTPSPLRSLRRLCLPDDPL